MAVTLQAILRDHYEAFAAAHPLADYQRDAARLLRECRTAAMGGHWRSCPQGHVHTAHYNSCKHRSCPQCAGLARERWLAGWRARLLECRHVHVIFTTPQQLLPLWRYNKRLFANLLFLAAADSLRELLGDEKYLGALPGLLAGLHTWSQTLAEHVHLHMLVTWGGLTPDGRWVEPRKKCLLPRAVLMHKFRGKFLAYLRRALERGELVVPPDRTAAQVRSLLHARGPLGQKDWNVKQLEQYEHGRGVLTYLARYLKGGPIGNGRLLDCRDGRVRFRYRDNKDRGEDGCGRLKTMSLGVGEFLARLLEHVPPPGLQTVRPYGLYANGKQAARATVREQLAQEPEGPPEKVTWRDLCERAGRVAATVCPVCGAALVVHDRFPRSRIPESLAQPPPGRVA